MGELRSFFAGDLIPLFKGEFDVSGGSAAIKCWGVIWPKRAVRKPPVELSCPDLAASVG